MHLPLIPDIVIILGSSVLIILLFQKVKLPPIIGFLVTGVVVGPYGLSLIEARREVELLSEIGVIFLLFVIGIEFSLKRLATIKKAVLLGGVIQVGLTTLVTALASHFIGLSWPQAVFIGFLFSLSSTAIVLNLLQANGEITAPHGLLSVAILIFQDIIVVPMMLFVPILAGQSDNTLMTLALLLVKVVGLVLLIIVLANYVVPFIFRQVVQTRSRELFILTTIVICFATAWLTSSIGLSLALGAFFAGMIISESDYSHQATANILPFREIFISFFFVSIGMLLDIQFLLNNFLQVLLMTFAVIVTKSGVIGIAVIALRYPLRTVILTALSIFQIGEFAFILANTGMQYSLLPETIYQYFLATSIMSMALTPVLFKFAHQLTDLLVKVPGAKHLEPKTMAHNQGTSPSKELSDHLVIIGYGINGKNLARAADNTDIPHVIVELNAETVRKAKADGEHIYFGDATEETILTHLFVHKARVVVIAISDPRATKKIVSQIRTLSKTVYIIVRTRFVTEIEENLQVGADEVIPEEFETSVEIFSKVLLKYLIPIQQIQEFTDLIRSQNYDMFRNAGHLAARQKGVHLDIPDATFVSLPVIQSANKIVGKTLRKSNLRENFDINVIAIKREDKFISKIKPDEVISQGDILYVFGTNEAVSALSEHLCL
ncbi:MAG: cation:proton antiporter [Reichenbachiella sp.]|uniref:cation:proton antiporter domain-containing protein n=1 Tax=Reichenbachiella sp. TaxID=2184521 RepID=UPI0032655625